MGLFSLDNLDDPDKQALLAMGLSMLAPKQMKTSTLQDIGQSGLIGLQTRNLAQQQERQNRQSDLQQLSGLQTALYASEWPQMMQPGYTPSPQLQAVNQRISDLVDKMNLSGGKKTAASSPPIQPMQPASPSAMPQPAGGPTAAPQSFPSAVPQGTPGAIPNNVYGVPMTAFGAAGMSKNPGAMEFLKSVVEARKPQNLRQGGTLYGYDDKTGQNGPIFYAPSLDKGIMPNFGPNGPTSAAPIPGYADAAASVDAATAKATQKAKQGATYVDVPVGNGQTMRMTNDQYEALRAGIAQTQAPSQPQDNTQIPPEVLAADRAGTPFKATQAPGGPVQFQQPPTGGMGGLGVSPNPAALAGAVKNAEAGATNRQKTITEDYQDLARQNVTAQTVISRLQTIKQLGPQAITGAEAEKRDFFNGLLSLVGVKSAENAKTASDLVDKNASQIALAIGTGPQGTDALRSLAQMANPNRHMTLEAMQRAADSIIAPLAMTQAKTQMLTPYFAHGDAPGYLQKKQTFEQVADPRVWELQSLSPQQQKTYVQSLSPQDARDLLIKRQTLKQIGVLQ